MKEKEILVGFTGLRVLLVLVVLVAGFLGVEMVDGETELMGSDRTGGWSYLGGGLEGLPAPLVMATESRFWEEQIEEVETIPFETEIEVDLEKDACDGVEVRQEGRNGRRIREVRVVYFDEEEYDRKVVAVRVEKPVSRVVVKGVKKVYKTLETDEGTINYWCALGKFAATAYDKNCFGCSETTATGMATGLGVVAVDPGVIPLGSEVYITGYGKAVAGDTGGRIRGRRIDLGFDTVGKWWGRREVEVYLL